MDETNEIQISKIVDEVKSQGLFDKVRRDCLSVVETEPAYQRLKNEVDKYCTRFLASQVWHANLDKTELRDRLREQLQQADFVNHSVRNLVDNLLTTNKVKKDLYPPIERIVCNALGIPYPSDLQSSTETSSEPGSSKVKHEDSSTRTSPVRRPAERVENESPRAKRTRWDVDENRAASAIIDFKPPAIEGEIQHETPVQDEFCPPPIDPAPSVEPSVDLDNNEISIQWHVTQLSPNTENEDVEVVNEQALGIDFDTAEIESPAHERL